jgi:hypothetical protein
MRYFSENLVFGALVFFIFSCGYETKQVIKPAPTIIDTTKRDSNIVVTRYSEVKNIFEVQDNNCFGCHADGSGGVIFSDYSSLKTYVMNDSTKFIKAITYTSNSESKFMPPSGKLPSDQVNKILSWIRQGTNP